MKQSEIKSGCGVIYVATGERFLREAAESLESLRRSNPGLPAMLLTDAAAPNAEQWDHVEIDASLQGQRNRAKLCMDRAPWERCLFLDTDTMVFGDLEPGFALLDRFEFAGVNLAGGHHYQLPGLPPSFPEINSGVLLWRKSAATAAVFRRWLELYDAYDQSGETRTWDQKSLRMALWESHVRFVNLPVSYNLMTYSPAALEGKLIIAHGRDRKNLERLHRKVSQSTQLRAYVPGIGVMEHPQKMSWGRVLNAIWRILAWKLRGFLGR